VTAEEARASRARIRLFLETVLIAGVYFISGKLGLKLARVHESATAVWPPTGIALSACLLIGTRAGFGVFLGALSVNLATSGSWLVSLGIAAGNTLEGVIGCLLVNRLAGGRNAFERPRDVFLFALLAAILSTTVSATVGVSSLWLAGSAKWSSLGSIWLTWWLGDLGGDLVVAPVIIVWGLKAAGPWSWKRLVEGTCLFGVLFLVTWAVFGGRLTVSSRNYPIDFLCIPAVLWASYRFGPRGTAVAVLLLSSVALWGTLRQFGPFPREEQNETLLLLQAFLGVTSVTAFVVAAAVQERRRASEALGRKLEEVARLNGRLDEQKEDIATYHNLLTHDISNITMALLGLLQRLLLQADGTLTEQQEGLLRRSNRQALEMNRMAENARALARVREQELPAQEVQLKIRGALDRAIQIVRDLHFDREFEIALDCPEEIEVAGTPLIESVLVNLVDNAVRHGPRNERSRIGVRVAREGERLLIAIRGGTPPSPDRIRQLFEKETKGERSSMHGIGLVLVREIVERAGGTVSATTVADERGEVFEVSLSLPAAQSGQSSDRDGSVEFLGTLQSHSRDGRARDLRES
jgi:integral membrane sensor domain MASE1